MQQTIQLQVSIHSIEHLRIQLLRLLIRKQIELSLIVRHYHQYQTILQKEK